jgi:hypothetical protein
LSTSVVLVADFRVSLFAGLFSAIRPPSQR